MDRYSRHNLRTVPSARRVAPRAERGGVVGFAPHRRGANTLAGFGRSAAGLTLVELLVAMAMATILVAIVAPALVQSRNRARAAACVSNLRQLGAAALLYSQDYGDRLPVLGGTAFASSRPTKRWSEGTSATMALELLAGRASPGVFRCPNDSGAPQYGFEKARGPVHKRTGSSYAAWSTVRTGRFGVSANGAVVSALWPASTYVLFRDYGSTWHGYRTSSGLAVLSLARANAVFADGHAKSTPVFEFSTDVGSYSCTVVRSSRSGVILALAGVSGDGRAELTGRYTVADNETGGADISLSLSGAAWVAGRTHEIDRVFSFGDDTELESALRQVVYWLDNLLGS